MVQRYIVMNLQKTIYSPAVEEISYFHIVTWILCLLCKNALFEFAYINFLFILFYFLTKSYIWQNSTVFTIIKFTSVQTIESFHLWLKTKYKMNFTINRQISRKINKSKQWKNLSEKNHLIVIIYTTSTLHRSRVVHSR